MNCCQTEPLLAHLLHERSRPRACPLQVKASPRHHLLSPAAPSGCQTNKSKDGAKTKLSKLHKTANFGDPAFGQEIQDSITELLCFCSIWQSGHGHSNMLQQATVHPTGSVLIVLAAQKPGDTESHGEMRMFWKFCRDSSLWSSKLHRLTLRLAHAMLSL